MYRLAARQNDNTENLLNLPTDDDDQASATSSPSPTLAAHRTSTVYVVPSKEATPARQNPATTVQVTHTVTAGAKSNTGVLVAAALIPFLVAGIVAVGFFFWLRRKRNTRSVYNVEAFNAATRDGDPSTPPTSPNKLKAYTMEKASQTRKKTPLQYHPDLETPLSGTKPRSDAANNNEPLQADDVPHVRIRLSARNDSSSSRPKPTPIQPSSGPFGPSQMRHPSASTKARPPQKPRGDKPLPDVGRATGSPADLYKASKKQKGSRKMQKYEAQSNKTQSLVSMGAQSVVSTGSTLVLPVIKPVQSIKRKPVPKELDLSHQSKAPNKAFRPPSSAVARSFAERAQQKHSTAMTQSSFYCQGDTSPAGAQPDSSPENTSSGDSGVLPTPGHVHRFSTLDQVEEEHGAPTLDAIQDLVQEMERHLLSDSDSSPSDSQRGDQLRGSIVGGMSVASVQSGMSYDAYGVPVPPPSLASASS